MSNGIRKFVKSLEKAPGIKSVAVKTYNRCIEEIEIVTEEGEELTLRSDFNVEMSVPHIILQGLPSFMSP